MPDCFVLNCVTRGRGAGDGSASLHKFPYQSVEPERYQKWLDFCQRAHEPGAYATVCSLHFAPEMFFKSYQSESMGPTTHRRLRRDAVPTVNGPAELLARATLQKASVADRTKKSLIGTSIGEPKPRKTHDSVETDNINLPSTCLPEDNADSFVSLQNVPIYCKLCKRCFTGGPCWTHARTVADRVFTPLAIASLPEVLYFEPTDEVSGKSVHTSVFIPLHTVFGPLIAPHYNRSPSGQDSSKRLADFQFENDHFCNWFKYVRTAADPTEQNIGICFRGIDVMFVVTRPIQPHEELKVYHPLLAKTEKHMNCLQRNNRIESRGFRNEVAEPTGEVDGEEFDHMLSCFLNGEEKTAETAGAFLEVEDETSTDAFYAEQAEPETATPPSSVIRYQILPPDDTLHSLGHTESQINASGVKRISVSERYAASGIECAQKRLRRSTHMRPVCTSSGEPSTTRSAPITSASIGRCRTADLQAGSASSVPSSVKQNVSSSRLSLLRKRRPTPFRSRMPILDVNTEGNGDESAAKIVVMDVPDKIPELITAKRITRLSAANSRLRANMTASPVESPSDAVDQFEMEAVDAMFDEEDDADYIPSDASESDSLPAEEQRAASAIEKSAPRTGPSLTRKVVSPKKTSRKQHRGTGSFPLRSDYFPFLYRHPCSKCGLKFYSTRILEIHKYQHEGQFSGREFPCDLKCIDSECAYTGTDAMDLAKHTNSHGKIVGEMTEQELAEPEHRSHAHCYSYACENQDCQRWFCTETLWRQHRMVHHPLLPIEIESLQCTACDYLATDARDLVQHVTEHGQRSTDRVQCPVCFHNVFLINKHYKRSHPDFLGKASLDFLTPCPNCPLRFRSAYTMSKHRRSCRLKLMMPIRDVITEWNGDESAIESVANSVVMDVPDDIAEMISPKRITRLSAARSRLPANIHASPVELTLAAVDRFEMEAVDGMIGEEDADYIPSDASDSNSLPGKRQRVFNAIEKSAPRTESSSPGKVVSPRKKSRKKQREPQSGPFPLQYIRNDYDPFLYRFPCLQCGLKFYSTRILNLHKYQHDGESSGIEFPSDLKCIDSDCGYTGTDALDLAKHTNSHGKIVGEMTEQAFMEPEHRSHAHCYSYACEKQDCHRWFCTETLWRQHRIVHYPLLPVEIESLQCTACDYLATDARDLVQHVTEHGRRNTERVQCPVCFHNVILINKHYKRSHPDFLGKASLDFPLPCPHCPLRFATLYTLAKHRRSCKRKLNQCYICAKQFETKRLLNEHLDSHLVNGQFPCPNCDFLTTTLEYVMRHMKHRHELSRIRVCEICQKVVNSAKRLNIHMQTHNQTMEFLCDQCGNRYNSSVSLRQHKRYVHGTYLKAYLARKAQEKREKGEVGKPLAKRHLALEDYPYRCEQCQTGFLKYGQLARHMQDRHGD